MQNTYKNAMNKISVDDGFEAQLKARLEREQQRIDSSRPAPGRGRYFKMLVSCATAAVVALAVTASFGLFDRGTAAPEKVTPPPAVEPMEQSAPTVEPIAQFSGSNSVCLAQNLSMRIVAEESAIKYNTNIFFTFEGFDKYSIETTGSCIVFETALAPNYTLANFFEDYYNLITNGTGISRINNGLIESFFDISDNGMRMISVFDGKREIIDLDTALMSDYKDRDNIHFIITIT